MRRTLWPASWLGRTFAFIIVWGLVLTVFTQWQNLEASKPPENRPIQKTDSGYVSSSACRSCHPGNYASWHASYHRTMTQVAKPENIIPTMNGLELSLDDAVYRIERKGDAYFVKKRAATAPDTAYEAPREIVLMTGSHNMQFFWIETGQG
ncbi:MAG TPA: hypothetical protein VKC60_09490, partial [Opitutaceae bacterium]|nr:hypothetical protein [Opitutaceae bacterium]